MPKSLKSQGFSEEEIVKIKRQKNKERHAMARANGLEKNYSLVLTKDYSDRLKKILETYSLTFPQFIRNIIDGKITISFPSEKENTK